MLQRLDSVLSALDLPLAELCGARLDGELFALDECWCPADTTPDPALRGDALRRLVSGRAIAELHSAAWIYGLCPEPSEHRVCVDVTARTGVDPASRLRVRERRLVAGDTALCGSMRATTPLRTTVDLALWAPPVRDDTDAITNPADVTPLLAALLRFGGFADAGPALLLCQARRSAHTERAQARLRDAGALLRAEAAR